MLVLSAALSSEPCCHLRRTEGASLLWRTPPSVLLAARARSDARARVRRTAVRAEAAGRPLNRRTIRREAAPARDRYSRVNSPTGTLCLSISCAHERFPAFFCAAPDFLPEKNQWRPELGKPRCHDPQKPQCRDYKNTNACTQKPQCRDYKNTNACTQKPQCRDHKNTNACTQKPQCRDHKNTNACTQKPQCRDHKNTNACARKPHCLDTRCGRGPRQYL
eukprot:COSAG02_NODE_2954_length_7671_cov_103.987718_1_plen_220_part_00